MGQATVLGSYPIHYHMAHDVDTVTNPSVQGNAIHHCFSRCVTIHGSHGVHIKVTNYHLNVNDIDDDWTAISASRTMSPMIPEVTVTFLRMEERGGLCLTTISGLELGKAFLQRLTTNRPHSGSPHPTHPWLTMLPLELILKAVLDSGSCSLTSL